MDLRLLVTMLVLVLVVGPLVLAAAGVMHARQLPAPRVAMPAFEWSLAWRSAIAYALAFNLTFLVQELGLVLPKAMVPGLVPTLFHNNHAWTGDAAVAALFQGTGVVATMLSGLASAALLAVGAGRSAGTRLFLTWMAYCGFAMALPQVLVGALHPGSDVGMAMQYLAIPGNVRRVAGVVAIALLPPLALSLGRVVLAVADRPERIATPAARTHFSLAVASLPLAIGTALVVPFRVPREWIEVLLVPAVVALPAIVWMPAGAWRARGVRMRPLAPGSIANAVLLLVLLLVLFQAVLRPGITFA